MDQHSLRHQEKLLRHRWQLDQRLRLMGLLAAVLASQQFSLGVSASRWLDALP